MADVSNIELESGTYQIKDVYARAQVGIWQNRRVLFFGDSYMEFSNMAKEIASLLHASYANYAKGGTRWFAGDNNFYSQVINSAVLEAGNVVTDVIIVGGYNDIVGAGTSEWGEDYFAVRIPILTEAIKQQYPGAK